MILILNSPLFRDRNDLYDEDTLPPLGLGYIATSLSNNGFDVKLIDAIALRLSVPEIILTLNSQQPDCVAINIFTTNKKLVQEIIEGMDFVTRVIVGGLSTRDLYKEIFSWETTSDVDIVMGDGELIAPDLINGQIKESPVDQKDNKRYFEVTSSSVYYNKDIGNTPLNRDFLVSEPVHHYLGFIEANIVTSRGCIFNCSFCAAARSLNQSVGVREMSAEEIIAEINSIIMKYPKVNSIRVLDDLFLKTKKTIGLAIDVFSKFSLNWRSMAHVTTFNDVSVEQLTVLKNTGCFELFIGIESGSVKVLKNINKTADIEKIIFNLSKVFSAGINVKGYFIFGFPDETEEDMKQTYELAETLKEKANQSKVNFRTSVFQYRPYHASEIFHDLKSKGVEMDVKEVLPNDKLSSLVGRLQFNFHSGNYSLVDTEKLHDFIYKTTNLNQGHIFGNLEGNGTSI